MRAGAIALFGGLAACFDPTPRGGLPCGANEACPVGLACTASGTCEPPGGGDGALDGGGSDGGGDAALDATPGPWTVAPIDLPPTPYRQDPTLTGDMLEMMWGQGVPNDLYVVTRASVGDAWSAPAVVGSLSTLAQEQSADLSRDGLTIYFVSDRGGVGLDVYVATRPSRGAPWTDIALVPQLSSPTGEHNVSVAGDRAIVDRETVLGGERDLLESTRGPSGWTAPQTIDELATTDNDGSPFLGDDHRHIYFHRSNPGPGPIEMIRAERGAAGDDFGTTELVLGAQAMSADQDPWVSIDGNTVVFSRGGVLYEATR